MFLQLIALIGINVMYAGSHSFTTPDGYKIGITYYMMMISVATSFIAIGLMMYVDVCLWTHMRLYQLRYVSALLGRRRLRITKRLRFRIPFNVVMNS